MSASMVRKAAEQYARDALGTLHTAVADVFETAIKDARAEVQPCPACSAAVKLAEEIATYQGWNPAARHEYQRAKHADGCPNQVRLMVEEAERLMGEQLDVTRKGRKTMESPAPFHRVPDPGATEKGGRTMNVKVIYGGIMTRGLVLGICVSGEFSGWLVAKHPDGRWVTLANITTETLANIPTEMTVIQEIPPATRFAADGGQLCSVPECRRSPATCASANVDGVTVPTCSLHSGITYLAAATKPVPQPLPLAPQPLSRSEARLMQERINPSPRIEDDDLDGDD